MKNSFPLDVVIFYSFCPLELSICIDAVGNPINVREKSRTMRICKINCVSCRHRRCIFNIYILLNRCVSLLTKKRTIILLMMVIAISLSLQGRCTGQTDRGEEKKKKKEGEKLNVDSICSASSHSLFSSSCLPESKEYEWWYN